MQELILTELLNTLEIVSEIYSQNKPHKNNKKLNHNDYKKQLHEKINLHKRHTRRLTPKLVKKKKLNSNGINISPIHNYQHSHHKSIQLTNNFHEKNKFYKNDYSKSQDKQTKINLVNQKFKIANDFNEENSNQFLNEKDECLKEVILTDEIQEEESIHFYFENEKGNIDELSPISNKGINNKLNSIKNKKK